MKENLVYFNTLPSLASDLTFRCLCNNFLSNILKYKLVLWAWCCFPLIVSSKCSYTEDEDFLNADAVFDCIGDPPEERFDLAFCGSLLEKQYVS